MTNSLRLKHESTEKPSLIPGDLARIVINLISPERIVTIIFNVITITITRVHACLYFIAPNGHKLKELDLEFMRRLCKKVNIIPVIGDYDYDVIS